MKKPKLPKKVRVGGFDYSVRYGNIARLHDGEPYLGITNNDALSIVVDPDYPIDTQRETLIHEILHAAFFAFSLRKLFFEGDRDKEEDAVSAISRALLCIIKDNPGLLK